MIPMVSNITEEAQEIATKIKKGFKISGETTNLKKRRRKMKISLISRGSIDTVKYA